jgi:hypothetical protein
VFPSVRRDTGCQSRFIIWHHTILWCDGPDGGEEVVIEDEVELRQCLGPLCMGDWQHYTKLAKAPEEVPWDVSRVCTQLARMGLLEEGARQQRGFFRLTSKE